MIDHANDRLLRLPEVMSRTALSRPTIYRKMNDGTFPPLIKISVNCSAWYESDINAWVADPVGYRVVDAA